MYVDRKLDDVSDVSCLSQCTPNKLMVQITRLSVSRWMLQKFHQHKSRTKDGVAPPELETPDSVQIDKEPANWK